MMTKRQTIKNERLKGRPDSLPLSNDKKNLWAKPKKLLTILSAIFAAGTTMFWVWLCVGSWNHELRPDVPASSGNGCAEFDLKPKISGYVYSPDPDVITKYSNGYVLFNRATFKFDTQRDQESLEAGTATIWLNPFTASLNIHYKIQSVDGLLVNGYRETNGIEFEWNTARCE